MGKNLRWMLATAVCILSIAMAGVGMANSKPVIRMDPEQNTAEPGETFTVDITVVDIPPHNPPEEKSLYGWEVKIAFDPEIINAVNATEGPFLKASGCETIWTGHTIDNTEGTISIGAMLTFPSPPTGANGSGTLATITFKAVSRGTSSLRFEFTDLVTILSDTVRSFYEWEYDVEDGDFSNGAGGIGGPTLSLGLVAGVVIAVAVCSSAVFYYMRRKASARA